MKKLSCIIIDDDPAFGVILARNVEKTEFLNLIGSYIDPEEGFHEIISKKPQLIFLDVEMPVLRGFDIIKNLNYKPEIILISSSAEFGIEAFNLGVTDYMQKPIENYARFLRSVEKARSNIESQSPQDDDHIFMKVDSSFVNILKDSIFFIQAYGDYVKVVTDVKTYVVKNKISDLEDKFGTAFLRVHRSYIVNLKKIKNIEQSSIEINGVVIPIGISFKPLLLERIKTI